MRASLPFAMRFCIFLLLIAVIRSSVAGEGGPVDPPGLPLKNVVLFTSGVGYFEHRGEIDGNGEAAFELGAGEVNDLLKSLVVEDKEGTAAPRVDFAAALPWEERVKQLGGELAALLTQTSTSGQLDSLRGAAVEIQTSESISGTIVAVEKRVRTAAQGAPTEVPYLILLTADGVRSVDLDTVTRWKLKDESLDRRWREALARMASTRRDDLRTIHLRFSGEGRRQVRVGYLRETPLWKTSYRLMVGSKDKALLQGWAIVENTTPRDWQNVSLRLVSGQPMSFRMDLYSSRFANRPMVENLLPQVQSPIVHAGALMQVNRNDELRRELDSSAGARAAGEEKAADRPNERQLEQLQSAQLRLADQYTRNGYFYIPTTSAAAETGEMGQLFQYTIDGAVSLPRGQSAMLPILSQRVPCEKIGIYNPAVHQRYPLDGLRIKNDTDLHLMAGPVTVYVGEGYAGDARIDYLSPKRHQLISYGLDLESEVTVETPAVVEELTGVRITQGALWTQRRMRRSAIYRIHNRSQEEKQLLVERAIDPAWEMIEPEKPAEEARDVLRFATTAAAGKSTELTVVEQQPLEERFALGELTTDAIEVFVRAGTVSDAAKRLLEEVTGRKIELAALAERIARTQGRLDAIFRDQERIRQNMAYLDRNSQQYLKYVEKLGAQESELESMRTEIERLTGEQSVAQQAFDKFLAGAQVAPEGTGG